MNNESASGDSSPETARAEEVVDAMARKVGDLMARLNHEVSRTVALAREEAEDIVADARSLHEERRA